MSAAAFLIILWNASNWGAPGFRIYEFPSHAACSTALAEMKIANEKPNSGVAVVAFCSPTKEHYNPKP